ncbi:GGDEF domain-containing protein, partial [Treponema socranskii]
MTPVINSVLTYLVVDFLCIAFSVFIIKKLTTDIGSELEIRMLKIMLQVFIAYSLVDAIWIVGEYGYMSFYIRIVNAVVCFFSIFLISVLSFFMFIYTEIRLKTAFMKKPELWIIASVPLAFSLFMCASSYYTGWIYYITPDNEYRRGPYYCWQMAIVFFYFVIALLRALCCGAKETMPMRRRATFGFALAIAVCFAIGSLQIFIPGTPLIVIAIFSGFLIMFVNFQQAQIFSDALTDLNNRRRANQYLETKFNSPLTEWPLYLFMFDINSFKEINDTYGHIEGDKALCIVAQALRMTSQKYSTFAARFGGDEFLLIGESLYVSSPDELINHFNKALEAEVAARRLPYTVTLSIGYAKTDGQSISIVELIKKADDMLYKNKSRAHSAAPPPPPPPPP